MSDALTRLALEAPTDAAARRIFEGRERDARNDPAARPRLLEHEPRERGRVARVRRRESHDETTALRSAYDELVLEIDRLDRARRRLRLVALVLLAVFAALAVAYLLTTGRVPMILV